MIKRLRTECQLSIETIMGKYYINSTHRVLLSTILNLDFPNESFLRSYMSQVFPRHTLENINISFILVFVK